MFKIGMVCMKIAGRDAGNLCVVVELEKDGHVLIEGAVRRRKCNVKHLEPTGDDVKVKAAASHAEVMKALGLEPRTTKARKPAERPRKVRKVKPKIAKKPAKEEKPVVKKETPPNVAEPSEKAPPKKEEKPAEKPVKKTVKKKKKA